MEANKRSERGEWLTVDRVVTGGTYALALACISAGVVCWLAV